MTLKQRGGGGDYGKEKSLYENWQRLGDIFSGEKMQEYSIFLDKKNIPS